MEPLVCDRCGELVTEAGDWKRHCSAPGARALCQWARWQRRERLSEAADRPLGEAESQPAAEAIATGGSPGLGS